jgi:hypothetical protein
VREEDGPQVTLHLWGVAGRHVPGAVLRMATQRRPLRAAPGLRFAKLLGTGDGRTFTVRDADPSHWGVLASWEDPRAAAAFDGSRVVRSWDRVATERLRVRLRPLASRGTWAGREPFGRSAPPRRDRSAAGATTAPVAAVTRARLRPRQAARFWRAVPPVTADLHRSHGLRLAVGIGEAPIGLQGTFSVWESAAALDEFAYRRPAHVEVIRRTRELDWYAEELFARFAVEELEGTFAGRAP